MAAAHMAGCGLVGGFAGAVEDADGGANVHQQGGADVGMPGHAGHVGGVELPGEQTGREQCSNRAEYPSPEREAGSYSPGW